MAVNLISSTTFYPINGVKIATTCAQIKQAERDDTVLFALSAGSTCAAVFTRNAFCAAPVTVARQHLIKTNPHFLLINSGNANAGTGQRGIQDAISCCETVAKLGECSTSAVLPFSTGVIGTPLPVEKIDAVLPTLLSCLSSQHWDKAARAIMTTDTVPKLVSVQRTIQGKTVTVTGIAKGAGMIRPDMATMLAFLATDATVPATVLQSCLEKAVNHSFNRITVDGDTSTNDSCVLIATGTGQLHLDNPQHPAYADFCQLVTDACITLAQAIVRDGEGATKFITIQVEQGKDEQECLAVAYTIAHSPLVKTAFFASDANWGRILAAIGRAGLSNLDINAVHIYLGNVCIVQNGGRATNYIESAGQAVMQESEITIRVLLGRGNSLTQVWTCDFTYDYVKINAEYRT